MFVFERSLNEMLPWQINKLHSTQFELLYFDGAIQFRCWGDTTSMLGRRNLGWGDKAMGRHNLHSLPRPLLYCFVKILNSCSPKLQSRVHKQNNFPSFGNKSMSSHIPTELTRFLLIYLVQNRRVLVSIKQALQTWCKTRSEV